MKKDPDTRHALKTNLFFIKFQNILSQNVCVEITLLQNFSSIVLTCSSAVGLVLQLRYSLEPS